MMPDQARAAYRRMIDLNGETVTLVHDDFDTGGTSASVRARVSGFKPEELVAGIDQGARRVIVLAEDVPANCYPSKNDKILIRPGTAQQRTLSVTAVDDSTRRVAGELIAFDITAEGL